MRMIVMLGALAVASIAQRADAQEQPPQAAPPPGSADGPDDPGPRVPTPPDSSVPPDAAPGATQPEVAPAGPATAEPPRASPAPFPLGGACRARAECQLGLRCFRNVCIDERAFPFSTSPSTEAWPLGRLGNGVAPDGGHFFLGGTFGIGPMVFAGSAAGVFQTALRIGGVFDLFEVQAEISPGTTALVGSWGSPFGLAEASGTVGLLVPLSPGISWVLRTGGGGGFSYAEGGMRAFGEVRADLVGVAIRTSDHLVVELDAPSYRLMLPAEGGVDMSWVIDFSAVYLF